MFKVNNYVKRRIFIAVAIILLVIFLQYIGIGKYLSLEKIQANKEHLQSFVANNYLFSVAMFTLFFIFCSFFSIPVTIILNLVAGFLFGTIAGTIYVNIGTTVGCVLAFLTFRYLLGFLVRERYREKLKKFDKHIKKYGHSYLLSLQIFPATPMFLINVLAGLTNLSVWTFAWTTSLGILPGSLVYIYSGKQLGEIESLKDIVSWPVILALVFLGLLAFLPVLVRKFNHKKFPVVD